MELGEGFTSELEFGGRSVEWVGFKGVTATPIAGHGYRTWNHAIFKCTSTGLRWGANVIGLPPMKNFLLKALINDRFLRGSILEAYLLLA